MEETENPNTWWTTNSKHIIGIGEEVFGKTSGKDPPQDKETWWWNNEVREKVKEKKEAKKTYDRMGNEEKERAYREANKEAKRAVAQAKARAREDMYDKLETREGEKTIFALAREGEVNKGFYGYQTG